MDLLVFNVYRVIVVLEIGGRLLLFVRETPVRTLGAGSLYIRSTGSLII